jgi:hypothetical protein
MIANTKFYEKLANQATKIGSYDNRRAVEYLIGEGAQNADDTVIVDKTRPVSDWEQVFVGSIELLLCSGEYNKTVCKWFATRGITF